MKTIRFLTLLGILFALLPAPLPAPAQATPTATRYFVSPSGSALHACTVSDPCSIDHAIEHAVGGDTIYLFEGTYTDYTGFNIADLSEDINMYGGLYDYWVSPTGLRLYIDPVNHPTILDGQSYRRGILIHGGVTPIIDGIQFINGRGWLTQDVPCGGTDLDAQGCGAGIYVYQAAPTIQNCMFYDNRAVRLEMPAGKMGFGGAIFVESPTGLVLIQHNVFDNNRATDVNDGDGAAIAIHGAAGSVTLYDNLFKNNVATYAGGGIAAEFFHGSSLLIQNNRFDSNYGSLSGAAIYLYYVDHAAIFHNWFVGQTGNTPGGNGTVEARLSGLTFTSNTLIDNNTPYGLEIFSSTIFDPKVTNNLFVRSGWDALIRVLGWGGVSGHDTFNALLKHNTLVSNGVTNSLGVQVSAVDCTYPTICADVFVDNTILFKLGTGFNAPYYEGGRITSDYTLFYQVADKTEGYALIYNEVVQPYAGFKDYLHDDYHLVKNALARDKGKNAGITVDFEGDPRPLGGGYDLGYDEFAYHTLVPYVRR